MMLNGARISEQEQGWLEFLAKHMYTEGLWPGGSLGSRFLKRVWSMLCAYAGAKGLYVHLDAYCSGARDLSPPCHVVSEPRLRDTHANVRFAGVILRVCRARAP